MPSVTENSNLPPVLIVHGTQDQIVPIEAARQAKDTLIAIGVDLEYREFPIGHEINPSVIALMEKFIFAKSLG